MNLFAISLFCRCPRCGKGELYSGLLAVADQCTACGLALKAHEKGDGPAFFVIVFAGFIITGLAIWVEAAFEPPLWVHLLLWPVVTLGLCAWLLRVFKAMIIALQFRHLGL